MPTLDVSFVISDPMLADCFDVTRNEEGIDEHGRVTKSQVSFPGQIGVVTQQDPAELMRRDDGQMVPRSIFVASRFGFRGAVEGFQPDVITWNRTDYLVKQVFPYSRYGEGIYECVAVSTLAQDVPQ